MNAVSMKNITVSVDDEIYHRARIRAAEKRTSVSALVRHALQDLAGEETEFERLKRLEREVVARLRARGSRFAGSDRLNRDELHDRDALR
jgi:Arc/MetJ-type ribon-helix-helix transcriptional regulator